MTEHEAIGYLLNKYLVVDSPINPPKEECEKHNAVLDMAIQSLAKQIAEKPLKGGLYSCPNCEKLLPYGAFEPKADYCKYCGQKLDWGDKYDRK